MPRVRQVLSRLDSNGLVVSEGDFWLHQRPLTQPALQPSRFPR
jgi:hypothetical protein